MRAAVIFTAIVATLLGLVGGGIAYILLTAPPPPPPRIVVAPVDVEPAHVELGTLSQCDGLITVRAELVNTSDKPMHLSQVIGRCGCTVPDLEVPSKIEPGGRLPFEVTLDPWAAPGPHTQQIDFIYAEAGRAPPMRISYVVDSPLRVSPGGAHRHSEPQAVLKIRADDGTPFLIQSIEPAVTEPWIQTPTNETHISLDWALVDEAARERPELFEFDSKGRWKRGKVTIRTDRAGCPEIFVRIYNTPTGSRAEQPTVGPSIRSP